MCASDHWSLLLGYKHLDGSFVRCPLWCHKAIPQVIRYKCKKGKAGPRPQQGRLECNAAHCQQPCTALQCSAACRHTGNSCSQQHNERSFQSCAALYIVHVHAASGIRHRGVEWMRWSCMHQNGGVHHMRVCLMITHCSALRSSGLAVCAGMDWIVCGKMHTHVSHTC